MQMDNKIPEKSKRRTFTVSRHLKRSKLLKKVMRARTQL